MRLASTMFAIGFVAAGCDNGKEHLHPPDGPPGPRWWSPAPGDAVNWDVQISAPFVFTEPRTMFIVDLFTVVPIATTLDYGDDAPVTVPAGAQPTAIAMLKANATTVVCRVGSGAIRLDDPDAQKFPGWMATMPTMTTSGVLGFETEEGLDHRYLDLSAGRTQFEALIWKRYELAKTIGCDAIEADRTFVGLESGFTEVDFPEIESWNRATAAKAHELELSVGMKNGYNVGLADALVNDFDWLVAEHCGEFSDCGSTRAFSNARKAVFALDFNADDIGTPLDPALLCSGQQIGGGDVDGLVKDPAQSSTFRHQCP